MRVSVPEAVAATMDVFVMIRRKQSTIFIDAKESTTILELKKMIQGILKVNFGSSAVNH